MRQRHAEYRVARFEHRHVHAGIGLRTGVRLHVGVLGTEQRLDAIDGQLLGDVDELAAAVVALARVTLGVLVGEHRTLRLHDRRTGVVLGSDQLDVVFLSRKFLLHRNPDFRIDFLDGLTWIEHLLAFLNRFGRDESVPDDRH